MRLERKTGVVILMLFLAGCSTVTAQNITQNIVQNIAPGAPGAPSTWAFAGKDGIGTSYESYDGRTGKISKVWFSVARGILTETMYGLIHQAQIKDMQFLITGDGFVDSEKNDTVATIDYLDKDAAGRPLSLAYRIITRDKQGKYEIEKRIFTDPDRNVLFIRVIFRALKGNITPYLYLNPHVNNTGSGDIARATMTGLYASDSGTYLALKSSGKFVKTSAGFVGVSDGMTDLKDNGKMDWHYGSTGKKTGNVALMAELGTLKQGQVARYDFAIGFGHSAAASTQAAEASLAEGYDRILARYDGKGAYVGWQDYIASLPALPGMVSSTTDGGKLLYTSAMVLKAQEDKTYPGALIASLSNPWGETSSADKAATGYKAVWPRDFYQTTMAFLALGDRQTALKAFQYLQKLQVTAKTPGNKGASGWFLQKTHVDGVHEWISVQLDQTAMPIMLGWKLHQAGILSDARLRHWYQVMLKPAADFLVYGGKVNLDGNIAQVNPPWTEQERWEEQPGYSPSTTAAVITGLVTAADIARTVGDNASAQRYLKAADDDQARLQSRMFTTTGPFNKGKNNGRYFLRITPHQNPNNNDKIPGKNGRAAIGERFMMDAGFLELVRYGVLPADNAAILDSLPELDDQSRGDSLRLHYDFTFKGVKGVFLGWRRYGNDGYGEDADTGRNYGRMTPGQRGRVWPIFTGERGHYELALDESRTGKVSDKEIDALKNTYVRAMELFANDGMMLPEQVWDGVGVNSRSHPYRRGEGTDSATPLAWAHAEYIKLVRSLTDRKVWDYYQVVGKRYKK
ncbi:MAG: glucan 1,4-alpha-glucosidase [Alphaproteobacteria bacterium]|nr:glucan 1,4-alpha-glucosidase [Alphaproteobacteria bacterium]